MRIRVMLVDAHRIALSGLQRLINDDSRHLVVVAIATSCAAAAELAVSAKADVVVLDIGLAQENEAAIVPKLINAGNTRVLILGGKRGDNAHEAAIIRGACGVVSKEDTPELLIRAIKKVHEGQLWLDRSTTGKLFVELSKRPAATPVADPAKRRMATLTPREHDVVRTLVTQPGADNRRLASSLHIGEHTLRNHLSRIYDKLGVPNRVGLYDFAQRHGGTVQLPH
jgi:two-component system, NarL family, nitrate/nitrite response regulator NarL